MTKELKDYIEERIKHNCDKNLYKKIFSEETQAIIEDKIDKIAKETALDKELVQTIDFAIEETIRLMILKNKKKQ